MGEGRHNRETHTGREKRRLLLMRLRNGISWIWDSSCTCSSLVFTCLHFYDHLTNLLSNLLRIRFHFFSIQILILIEIQIEIPIQLSIPTTVATTTAKEGDELR